MDGAQIPLEVALSCVLAAAVEGADRRGLLAALHDGPNSPSPAATDRGPALVYAFPAPSAPEDDGPNAA